ncbi:uncharacterized protein DAT39_022749, partial [Clarias magur]
NLLLSFPDMPRAKKEKAARVIVRAKRSRGTKRTFEGKDKESSGMGGAASSREGDPPKQDNATSLQTTAKDMSTQTRTLPLSMTLPKEPDYSRMIRTQVMSSLLLPLPLPLDNEADYSRMTRMMSTPPPPMPLPKEPDYSRM